MLNELQINRRELENELASMSQKEISIKGDLKKLEEGIIAQLERTIEAKKVTLSGLESQKIDLERRLRTLQGNPTVSHQSEEQHTDGETGESQQEPIEENEVKLIVGESQPQQIEESGQRTRTSEHNLLF